MKEYKFTENWFQSNDLINFIKFNNEEELHFLEIGPYEGKSTIWFIETYLKNKKSTITCIDPWLDYSQDENSYSSYNSSSAVHKISNIKETFDYNINLTCQSEKVIIHKEYSHNILPKLIVNKNQYDLIYIDGNHTAPFVLSDAIMSWYLLKNGGILIFDDYLWKNPFISVNDDILSPKIAIDSFVNIFKYNLKELWKKEKFAVIKT